MVQGVLCGGVLTYLLGSGFEVYPCVYPEFVPFLRGSILLLPSPPVGGCLGCCCLLDPTSNSAVHICTYVFV